MLVRFLNWTANKLESLNEELFPSALPPWIRVAKQELGVKEFRGRENPRIIEYHSATALRATEDEVAWCSSFVNWVCRQCRLERSGSAAARSWLAYGETLPGFKKYAIVIMKRGNSSWQGHVGFAIDDLGESIRVLGGNQSDQVCYAIYPKSAVIGYRWPQPATET